MTRLSNPFPLFESLLEPLPDAVIGLVGVRSFYKTCKCGE